ncbi:hypothetical protein [Paracoccus aminophilus]|uniref:Uncharacterized protein n=1 Tax=Paracoccus aminophilus JCM 7686 TaxID=1367847 RepID=S5XKX8_PARAH|nr:hypothetical protein [Paracoccus aminophilus]AGT07869.1 hypothetical protein JCM7686_0760 [Paracoccus aminophilus JCM 7686]
MARGFAKGLFQGVILCGAAVAALSLALPQPRKDGATVANPGPDAAALDLPVGSEFGRGEDETPVAPVGLSRPNTAALGDAPAVVAPSSELRPAPAKAPAARPETAKEAPVAPVALAPISENPDLPAAPGGEAPIPVEPPGRVETPTLDRAPEQGTTETAPDLQGLAQNDAPDPRGRQAPAPAMPGAPASDKPASDKPALVTPAPATPENPTASGSLPVAEPAQPVTEPTSAPIPQVAPKATASKPTEAKPSEAKPTAPTPTTPKPTTPKPTEPKPTGPASQRQPNPGALDLSLPPDPGGLHLFDRN